MKQNQAGFTLIEIAIVLVIIGLLLGGVLKGQELINSAKVKNLATDFRNIPLFIYGYQDKYRALPGDDNNASTHVGGLTPPSAGSSVPGNGVIEGTWDAGGTSGHTNDESNLFWQHVRLANLAAGPTASSGTPPDFRPTNSNGGLIGVTNAGESPISGMSTAGSYVICSSGIQGKFAKQLEITMDDSSPNTGSMREILQSAGTGTAAATLDDNLSYIVCMAL